MTEQIDIAGEIAEPHHFGSHNIYMPQAPIGRVLPYYPWRTLYEQLHFETPYPQLLYTNAQADALFEALSLRLAALVADEAFSIEASLQYPEAVSIESVREGYLTVIITDPILEERLKDLPIAISRELLLDMLTMSLLQYILQTEMGEQEQLHVALVEMPQGEREKGNTDLRPEWVKQWERTQKMLQDSDGTYRYRYGFRLTLED